MPLRYHCVAKRIIGLDEDWINFDYYCKDDIIAELPSQVKTEYLQI